MRAIRRFLPFFALALLSGCAATPEQRVVGVWRVDESQTDIPDIPINDLERRVRRFLRTFVLKIRSDKTFVVTAGPTIEGTWSLEGRTIRLSAKEGSLVGPLGALSQTLSGQIGENYQTMVLEQPPVKIVLVKKA